MPFYSPDYFKNPIKLNRPISEEERENQLKQKEEQPGFDENVPHYQLSVIQHNSTFVEIVDRNYPVRGIATFLGLFGMSLMGLMFSSIFMPAPIVNGEPQSQFRFNIFVVLMTVPGFFGCLYFFRREAFYYTHFPIRLNRKTRKVYIWRKTGVVTASWDKVFFFLRRYMDSGSSHWDVRGNVLAEDGKTVIDSFPFGGYSSAGKQDMALYFEYFRRYMEVGPEQTWRMLKVCLPIAKRKETWWEGMMRLMLNLGNWWIVQILMLWFFLPISLARWFAMRTSRIPQWPEWVEKECAVEADDLYVRESGYVAPRSL